VLVNFVVKRNHAHAAFLALPVLAHVRRRGMRRQVILRLAQRRPLGPYTFTPCSLTRLLAHIVPVYFEVALKLNCHGNEGNAPPPEVAFKARQDEAESLFGYTGTLRANMQGTSGQALQPSAAMG
jgi:hypothetical protein